MSVETFEPRSLQEALEDFTFHSAALTWARLERAILPLKMDELVALAAGNLDSKHDHADYACACLLAHVFHKVTQRPVAVGFGTMWTDDAGPRVSVTLPPALYECRAKFDILVSEHNTRTWGRERASSQS